MRKRWPFVTIVLVLCLVRCTQSKPLISEDPRLFITVEWATENQVLLRDNAGVEWLLDVPTGQVVPK